MNTRTIATGLLVSALAMLAAVAQARAAVRRLDVAATANAPITGGDDHSEWSFLEEFPLEHPDIRFPDLALGLGVGGAVVVAFQGNEDGRPTQIRVLSAPHPLLALRQAKIHFELE